MAEVFHRPQLAADMALRILHPAPTSASGAGLFLAAPRRTGKSTFLREDLRPELERLGALVIYADLWADRAAEPGGIIIGAVRQALVARQGVVARLARSSGVEKVGLGGFTFSLERTGLPKGVSLTAALTALSDETRQVIVLIIDEAQHAITSENGSTALFALKAARDELNSSRHHGLRIVATGSNRDKLAMLRASKDQAFFGAPLVEFPHLGEDYVRWFVGHLPFADEVAVSDVQAWFEEAAFRPEILGAAVDTLQFDFSGNKKDYGARLHALVQEQIAAANQDMLRVVRSLTPLQSAVLRVMAVAGADYAPFEQVTLTRYQAVLARLAPKSTLEPDAANVQAALGALQERSLVWRATRGVYALEDSNLAAVMRHEGMLEDVPQG